jgi:hypothetical protein
LGNVELIAVDIQDHHRRLNRLETQEIGAGAVPDAALNFPFYRGGELLASTQPAAFIRVHFAGSITGWSVFGINASGTVRFNVAKATYAAYSGFTNIDGTDPPELSSENKANSTALTGWTTAFAAGDIFKVEVDSAVTVVTIEQALVVLQAAPS